MKNIHITEQMAYELCEKHGLLSPCYKYAKRGGCWFCPNQTENELKHLYWNHRDLYNLAMWLETLPDEFAIKNKDGKQKRMIDGKGFLKEYAEKFEEDAELERNQIRFDV